MRLGFALGSSHPTSCHLVHGSHVVCILDQVVNKLDVIKKDIQY